MNEESYFLFEVLGRPKDAEAIEKLTRKAQRYMIRIDPEVKLATVNFARLFYKLHWKGLPESMYHLTLAQRNIIKDTDEYLEEWEINIEVKIIEKGDG